MNLLESATVATRKKKIRKRLMAILLIVIIRGCIFPAGTFAQKSNIDTGQVLGQTQGAEVETTPQDFSETEIDIFTNKKDVETYLRQQIESGAEAVSFYATEEWDISSAISGYIKAPIQGTENVTTVYDEEMQAYLYEISFIYNALYDNTFQIIILESKQDAVEYLREQIRNRALEVTVYTTKRWKLFPEITNDRYCTVEDPKDIRSHIDYIRDTVHVVSCFPVRYDENVGAYKYTYIFEYNMSAKHQRYVEKKAASVAEKFKGKSQRTKVKEITKWLGKNMKFKVQKGVVTPYYSFKNKRGQCYHYAIMFCEIARYAGLDARYVTGNVRADKGWEYHAWNIVKIGEKWYYVDPCWADGKYFYAKKWVLKGKNDRNFKKTHRLSKKFRTKAFKKTHPMAK